MAESAPMSDSAATGPPASARGGARRGRERAPRAPRKRDAEVLDAAARVFYEQGYADTSVQDVADAVGILKGSLYHYIQTKEDLLYRLLEEVHEKVHEILEEVQGVEGLAPLDRLHLYVSRQIEYNARNLIRISVYYHDVERLSEQRRKAIYVHRRAHEDFVTNLIAEAQAAGQVDAAQDPQLLANCVFGTVIWIYRWYRPRGRIRPAELAEMCADFALAGVRGQAFTGPAGG